jgi:hypothetical protein
VIRTPLPRRPTRPRRSRSHHGPHYSSGGHHSGESPRRQQDGLGMTLTLRLRSGKVG